MLVRNLAFGFSLFLCLVLVALVFGQLNDQTVSLDLLFAQITDVSLFTLFVITFTAGGCVGLSISLFSDLKQGRKIKQLNKKLAKLEQEASLKPAEGG